MVDGRILFRFEGTTYSGNDVPLLVADAVANGPVTAATLYARLHEVGALLIEPRIRRVPHAAPDTDSERACGLLACERSAFLNNDTYRDELQAFFNGFQTLEDALNDLVTLRSIDTTPVAADADLYLYAHIAPNSFRYHAGTYVTRRIDRADDVVRITAVREPRQRLLVDGVGLQQFAERDRGAARYALEHLPPTVRDQTDLVRVFLHQYVTLKRRMWREHCSHYPVMP